MHSNEPTSISDSYGYTSVVKLASNTEEYFLTFKQNNQYNQILEHVTPIEGEMYYNSINSPFILKNISRFAVNDILGGPRTSEYSFGRFSPTTLRYARVLTDISKHQLDGATIIEIGAGYGGQYTVLRQLYKPKKYIFVDLPEVLELIKKYVNRLGLTDIELEYLTYRDICTRIESNLIISNYAISECIKPIQDVYINNILNCASHGYITFNHFAVSYPYSEFIQKLSKPVKYQKETPDFGHNNIIIEW
jgi:putative sugar O-methyltransferase